MQDVHGQNCVHGLGHVVRFIVFLIGFVARDEYYPVKLPVVDEGSKYTGEIIEAHLSMIK